MKTIVLKKPFYKVLLFYLILLKVLLGSFELVFVS